MKKLIKHLSVIGLLISCTASLFAGNQGKLIGKVTDIKSGEPIIGVNVLVVGTTRGAITDLEGKFQIIGIPIGNYTVRASQVGYASMEVTNVKIGADETTQQNFRLTSSEVQLQGVTVTADKLLVNSLVTSSSTTVGEKSIQSIPNVKTVDDVLKLQAGVVKQGNQLYLRGGRADEVVYLVDGMPTNNVLGNSGDLSTSGANQELAKIYAGVTSGTVGGGNTGLALSANAIQSVSVQASNFDADYGNAQSGIVNIVTKSGSDRYTGSLQYRTDKIGSDNQNESYSAFSIGGPEPLSKYLLPDLGIKIPGSLTFFLNADINRSDTYSQFAHNEFYNPIERKIELNGFLGGIMNSFGFRYRDNQRNSFTFNSKLKYDISGDDQVSYGYRASLSSNHGYSDSWKYRSDSSSIGASLSTQHNFSWQHFFSPQTFFKFFVAKLENRDGNDVAGLKPMDYSSADSRYYDVNDDGFNELGTSQRWYSSLTSTWSTRFDFASQVHPMHFIKTGMEFYLEEINSTEIINPTYPYLSGGVEIPPPNPDPAYARGIYPGYGRYRYHMNQYPNHGALYLQDNIELSGINLHVGLRYDFFDIGAQVYDAAFLDQWKYAYNWIDTLEGGKQNPGWVENMPGETSEEKLKNGRDDMTRFWYYFTHGYFSPRLSIGYPVTDRIVFYFNYGHFLQFPDRGDYYRDPFVAEDDFTIGNPDLKPQRTVSYEAGFDDQFSDDMAFGIHAFYKDIFDYSTAAPRGQFQIMKNLDYASTRGFELTLQQSFAGNFSVAASYTYQIAKGRSSNKNNVTFNPQEFLLARETRLNWDQNHTGNLFASYRVGPQEEGQFFGLPFINNYGISVTWSYGSGYPYNGYTALSRETAAQYNRRINSETTPYTTSVDLSVYKGLRVFETLNMLLTFDIINLLNRRNPTRSGIYNYTGRVYQYGDFSNASEKVISPWRRAEFDFLSPYNFDAPRQILIGLKLNWD